MYVCMYVCSRPLYTCRSSDFYLRTRGWVDLISVWTVRRSHNGLLLPGIRTQATIQRSSRHYADRATKGHPTQTGRKLKATTAFDKQDGEDPKKSEICKGYEQEWFLRRSWKRANNVKVLNESDSWEDSEQQQIMWRYWTRVILEKILNKSK